MARQLFKALVAFGLAIGLAAPAMAELTHKIGGSVRVDFDVSASSKIGGTPDATDDNNTTAVGEKHKAVSGSGVKTKAGDTFLTYTSMYTDGDTTASGSLRFLRNGEKRITLKASTTDGDWTGSAVAEWEESWAKATSEGDAAGGNGSNRDSYVKLSNDQLTFQMGLDQYFANQYKGGKYLLFGGYNGVKDTADNKLAGGNGDYFRSIDNRLNAFRFNFKASDTFNAGIILGMGNNKSALLGEFAVTDNGVAESVTIVDAVNANPAGGGILSPLMVTGTSARTELVTLGDLYTAPAIDASKKASSLMGIEAEFKMEDLLDLRFEYATHSIKGDKNTDAAGDQYKASSGWMALGAGILLGDLTVAINYTAATHKETKMSGLTNPVHVSDAVIGAPAVAVAAAAGVLGTQPAGGVGTLGTSPLIAAAAGPHTLTPGTGTLSRAYLAEKKTGLGSSEMGITVDFALDETSGVSFAMINVAKDKKEVADITTARATAGDVKPDAVKITAMSLGYATKIAGVSVKAGYESNTFKGGDKNGPHDSASASTMRVRFQYDF